jgi:hypothetical protein
MGVVNLSVVEMDCLLEVIPGPREVSHPVERKPRGKISLFVRS